MQTSDTHGAPRLRPLAIALVMGLFASPSLAATITVNSNADTAADDGVCTLREAITAANMDIASGASMGECAAGSGIDTIAFAIGSGAVTISPTSALPDIVSQVHIDGYTQPGSSPNTLAVGNDAVIAVRLDGAASGGLGLYFTTGSDNSSVRGLTLGGFSNIGILLDNSSGTTIAGNFIGTDGTGANLHNGTGVVLFSGSVNHIVGGSTPADRNVISSNTTGISIGNATTTGNEVRGNYIGTAPDGVTPLRNGGAGVNINGAPGTKVVSNTISPQNYGIYLTNAADNTTIQTNAIGVGADGAANTGGAGSGTGIQINSGSQAAPSTIAIGGEMIGDGNTIANLNNAAIRVDRVDAAHTAPNAIAIRGNAIYNNAGLGIDLADSATGTGVDTVNPNDPGDGDTGANDFQNFPVITSATYDGTHTVVNFTLNSESSTHYNIDLYVSPSCDGSGHGEGKTWLGSALAITNAGGDASETTSIATADTVGQFITLTATRVGSGTSEFSACMAVSAAGGAGTPPLMGDVPDQSATVGMPFSLDIAAYVTLTEGNPIAMYVLTGDLPPGLGIDVATGHVSGTPTTAGTWTASFVAFDNDGMSNADSVTFTVAPAAPSGTPPLFNVIAPEAATVGVPYNLPLSSSVILTEGDPILSYALSGVLPPGLTFDPVSGVISGTPTVAGSYNLAVTATDKDGMSSPQSFTLIVAPAAAVPTLSQWAQMLLASMMACVGWFGFGGRGKVS